LHAVENSKCTGQARETSADRETGLRELQIQTSGNKGKLFRGLIIKRIMISLEARIAQEWGKRVQ